MISKKTVLFFLFIAIFSLLVLSFITIDDTLKIQQAHAKARLLEMAKSNYYIIYRNFNWYAQYHEPYARKNTENALKQSDAILFRHQEFQEKNPYNCLKYYV